MTQDQPCQAVREALPSLVLGQATPAEQALIQRHLPTCPDCQRELIELETVLAALASAQAAPAPAGLRQRLLAQAQAEGVSSAGSQTQPGQTQTSRMQPGQTQPGLPKPVANPVLRLVPWLAPLALAAAAVAAMVVLPPNLSGQPSITALTSTPQGSLVLAASGQNQATISMVSLSGARQNLVVSSDKPSYFTRALSYKGWSYLLDGANSKLYIIDEATFKLIDTWPVPAGAVSMAVEDMNVVVKVGTGDLLVFRRKDDGKKDMVSVILDPSGAAGGNTSATASLDKSREATAMVGNLIYATRSAQSVISVVDLAQGKTIKEFKIGQKPVALAVTGQTLFVLDQMGTYAYVSTPDGWVTAIKSDTLEVVARKQFAPSSDLSAMPDGHAALAQGQGVLILDEQLQEIKRVF
jgi:anti-sigma factor RsiW